MSDLKPCPFCGGEANTLHRPHVIDWRYSVGCNDDECRGFIGLSWLYKTEAEAIAAWNSRAERTCKMQPSPFTDWAGLNMRIVAGWYCENCGECCLTETTIDDDHPTPNYCPNCGRKCI